MVSLDLSHKPEEWWLYNGVSEVSLKTIHVHTGNKYNSIPVGNTSSKKFILFLNSS